MVCRGEKGRHHISFKSVLISRITILTLKSTKILISTSQKNHIQMGITLMNFWMIYHQEALRHWLVLSHCCLHQKSALYSAHQRLELILHHHRHPQKSPESLLLFVPLQAIEKWKSINFLRDAVFNIESNN